MEGLKIFRAILAQGNGAGTASIALIAKAPPQPPAGLTGNERPAMGMPKQHPPQEYAMYCYCGADGECMIIFERGLD